MAKKLTEEEKKALLNQAVKNINSGKAFSGKTGQQAAKDYAQKHNIQPKAHRATAAKSSAGKTASRPSGKASGGSRGAAKSAGGKSAPGIPQYLRPKLTRASLINEPLHPVLRAKIHSRPVQRASGGFGSRTPAATREGLQLPSVPGTTMRSRMADFDQLTKNSVDWHFADDARKQELFNQNELIRQRYGLKFDPHSGDTFSGNINLSAPVMPEVEKQRDYDKQNPLSVIGHNTGAGLAGISGGAYKTLDFLLPDVITPKSVQEYINKAKRDADEIQNKVRDYNYERGGKVGGLAGDLYQNAIGMIPQAVMAYLTAGASEVSSIGGAADDVLSRISSTLAKNTSAMTSFASTVGSDYENAKANGASDAEAAVSAILSSAASAGIETAGGIEAGRRTGSRLKNALQTGFEEGTEEVAQGLSTAATEKLVYDQDRKMFGEGGVVDPARMGQEFLAGNLLGGFFGGASKPDSRVETSPASQRASAAPLNPMRGDPVDAANSTADAAYRAQIDGVFDGSLPSGRKITLGETPEIIQQYGANAREMTMTQSVARKIAYPTGYLGLKHGHNLGMSVLKNLPQQLRNPVAILKNPQPNASGADSVIILTSWNDKNGNPIIIPVQLDVTGALDVPENVIASAFGAEYIDRILGRNGENVLYTKNSENIDHLLSNGRPMPEAMDDDIFANISIAQNQQNNNTANQNPVQPDSSVGAAQGGFDPYTQMANEYGTIQPGENPARIVDVPRSTDGSDKVRQFARTAMEAKVTLDEMIPAFEQQVQNGLFSYRSKKDKPSLDMAVKMIDQLGIEGALARWDDVTSGRRSAGKEDIVLAELLYSKAAQMGDTQTAMKLAAEIAAEGTRAGQTVQALRLLKRTTPEGKLYYIRKTVQNIQDGLTQKRGKNAPQLTIDDAMAQNLLNAQTEADADKAIDAIYDDVAKQIPPTFGDRLNAWRYFAMLGNPRTHIRNVVGNMVMQLPVRASNKLSASLQSAFIKDPEQRTRSLKRAKGAKEYAKADFEQMKNVLSGNAYTSEMSEIQQRQRLFPRPLQAVMDVNTNALDAEDAFFKKMTYINSLADFLSARGVDLNNVPADVLEQGRTHAMEDAKKATFQDASALADAIGRIENKNKATKLVIGGLVPFKRTPINIVKRGFEYSPAGLIKGLTADLKKVRNGTMGATEAIDHIAQGLTGTAIAALGYFLASNDLLSASEPENDKEREFGAAQGSQEYALNIGDYSYTIDWAAPAALPLFVGAEFYNALTQKYDGEEQAFNQAMDSLSRLFEPMINMTMLSGVGSTIQSAQYSNTNPIFAVGENIVQNYAGQVVPTLLGQIARTADDTRRTTYVNKDSWVPGSVQKFMQRQANKIPGLSKMQPAYTDVWGREDKTENVALRAFENFLSPGYINKRKTTDAEKALQALYDATGDTAVLPSKPQKSYTIEGVKHNLSANEWLKLTNEKGKISLDAVDALTKSAAYQAMSDAEKVSAVKDVYDYAAAVAANSTYGKELEGANKTVHESKIDPGLYFAYKEMQDTLNETLESYEARDAVFQTIRDDSSLSDYQKNQLYHTLLMKGTSQSQFEKYQAISDKVTAAEYVDAMIQSQAIKAYGDELEEGRATAEATEFSYYLDQMGYTGEKRDALANTFKFYNMFPAKPQNYTFNMMRENGSQAERENVGAIESSGISAAQYMQIKTLASGATWEKGKSGAKLAAYGKIVSENTANYDQYAAVMRAMGYKNISNAYTGSGTLPDAADMTSQVSRSNTLSETGINPVAAGEGVRMGSGYGYRDAPTAGASTFHEGNDIPAPMGTPVVAYKSGTVSYVGDSGSGGNMVQIDHPDGTKSVYLHLQDGSFAVKAGDKVGQGQQIAKVGSTGISTGPHLDFRIMVDGKYVDPKGYYPGY